jgi:two-component system cell cycle response regulator
MSDGFEDFEDEDELGKTKITARPDLVVEQARATYAHLVMLVGPEVGRVYRLDGVQFILGRSPQSTIRVDDDSISRAHCRIKRSGNEYVLEDLDSSNGTFVNEERVRHARLKDGDKVRVGEATIFRFGQGDLDERFQQQLYDAALRDALTGAYNKRYFLDALAKELRFAMRHGTSLVLVMFDIDHFKRINDTFGHLVGDHVLAQLGKLAHSVIRTEDVFARYGGEEFGIVARSISLDQGAQLAERLRVQVEATPFVTGSQAVRATLSLGVAEWQPHLAEPEQFIEAADEALYEAKRSGRNRVVQRRPVR